MKSYLVLPWTICLLILLGNTSYSQINITSGLTNAEYAQELIGQGVAISNINVDNNNANQIGLFSNGGATNLGLDQGLVLSSGNVSDINNQALVQAGSDYTSIGCGLFGLESCPSTDPDLIDIAGTQIYDHSILEFDFVPTGPTITFRFVFASDEYPGFVNSSYNDAFGIFLNGPGITGPYANNATNIALIPNTSTAVAINNVNGGYSIGCPQTNSDCVNCAYYINNCGGTSIVFNGFTTVITASYAVECGESYHVKFGIADAGDGSLDSGVFIEANSFESSELEITPNPATVCEGDAVTLTANLEGSTGGSYYWEPTGETTQSITVSPSVSTDYTVTYTVGTCSITDDVTVVVDNCSGDPCFMSNIDVTIHPCETNGTFEVTGFVEFQDAPTTGQLVFEDCNGNSTTINAPFTSPTNFTVSGIAADGAPCNMTAYFTADPNCSIDVSYGNTANCDCNAFIGTFTATGALANNTTPLCYGDNFSITANGDFIPADEANNPPLSDGYDPGIAWFVFSCPPTIPFVFDPITGNYLDPCFVGFISAENIGDLNDLSFINQFPPGTFTDNIIYYLPVTMYNIADGYISYVNTGEPCFQVGSPYGIQYLTEVTESSVEDCQAGTVTTTVSGGSPEVNGTNFTGSNLLPTTATFTVSTTSNGGNIIVSGLVDGDVYSYDITDEFGCSITVSGIFTGVSASDFTYPSNEYCKDEANPITTITGETGGVFTGTTGLSINSTTGEVNLASTPAGSYTVTYTSPGAPCNSQSTFDITIYEVPVFTITYTEPSCGNQDGEIVISGLNPSTNYDLDYTYNGTNVGLTSYTTDAAGNIILSNLDFGTYSNFEITGAGDCTTIDTNIIDFDFSTNCDCNAYVGTFTETGASANTTTPLCFGDSYSIEANGDYIPADEATNPPSPLGYDPGVVWFLFSCPPTLPFVFDPVTGDYSDPCFLGFIPAADIDDVNDLSFINSFPPGVFTDNILYFLPVTMYDVANGMISYVNSGDYCYDVGDVYSFQYLPEITESSVEDCQAGTVTTTISGGSAEINGTDFTGTNLLPTTATFDESTVSNGGNIIVSGLVDGDLYSYDIADEFGCSITVTGTFTGASSSDFTYPNTEYCKDETNPVATVTGESGGVFTGTSGLSLDPTTGEIDLATTLAGSYTITYTSPGAPCNSESTFDITIYEVPSFTVTFTEPTCESEDGEIVISGLSPSTTYDLDYTVNGNNVGSTTQTTDATGNITLPNLGFGTYSNFEIVGAGNCSSIVTDVINLNPSDAPQVSAPDDIQICIGESVTLTAQNPDGATISWDNGVTDGVGFTPTSAGSTTYTVSATIDGCTSTDAVTVLVHALPNVDAGQDQDICEGEAVTLTASGAASYIWDSGENGASISVSPTQTTTYTVTGTSVHGCENTDNVTVTVYPYPVPSFTGTPLTGCSPHTVNFVNTTPNIGGSTCLWDFGDGTTSTDCNPTHTYHSSGLYDVTLTVTNTIGCENTVTYTAYVEVVPSPIAAFTADPEIVSTLDSWVNFFNQSENATDYLWSFGDDMGTATTVDVTHDYSGASGGQYVVTLVASNGMPECNDTAEVLITVNEDLIFYVPNTFTPDSDNFNEIFKPVFSSGYDPQSYTLEIFNRWGELIFESHNVDVGWDGTYGVDSNNIVKDGVYVWKIKIKETGKDKHNEYVGHVSLLK